MAAASLASCAFASAALIPEMMLLSSSVTIGGLLSKKVLDP
jgi:hypothetical protein